MSEPHNNQRNSDPVSAQHTLQIGLVPLIDLSLTLVVVFLVFMPMALTSLIPISSSPKTNSGEAGPSQDAPILLEVDRSSVRIGPVSFESELALTAWLRDAATSHSNRRINVKVLPDVSQERLVRVLDWIRTTAEWKVMLLTLKDEAAAEAAPANRRTTP